MCVCEKNNYCIMKSEKLMLNPLYFTTLRSREVSLFNSA